MARKAQTARTIAAVDGSCGRLSAAILVDEDVVAECTEVEGRGRADTLADTLARALRSAGLHATGLDVVACTVGPGSFTGIRATLAVAHGLALASGATLVAVSVGEALAEALPNIGGRSLWVAIDSRRGHVFLDRGGIVEARALIDLPDPASAVALAGDAAAEVAARLAARDFDVMLTDARLPRAGWVGRAAQRQLRAGLAPRPAMPLYIDPAVARPAPAVRPAPAGDG